MGDGETAALIARDGSIDFLCWPRFDSDACFAALLGDESHGHWRIAPVDEAPRVSRRYRENTLILETTFETGAGAVRLVDFMPVGDGPSQIIRIVEGLSGEVELELSLRLRFDYGSMPPWSRPHGRGLLAEVGPDRVVLYSPVQVELGEAEAHATFRVVSGQRLSFTLAYSGSTSGEPPPEPDTARALAATEEYWTSWIGRFRKPCGEWAGTVRRSLIVLRALIHRRTGGLLAAATTSLPEVPGGTANWDYRYCWLRDATFALTALLNAGYQAEASAWRDWILRAVAGRPEKMDIVYRLDGARRLPEWTPDWLPGFQGAAPVRVGNGAYDQNQLDVYGELLNSMHVAARGGIPREARGIEVEAALVKHLEAIWRRPGCDIWEQRGEPRNYTYSKAMACVGIKSFLHGARTRDAVDGATIRRLEALSKEIHDDVCEHGYNRARGHFVQHYGSSALDASLLILPLVNFLPVDDPRMAGTIAAIERELMEGGLVRRMAAKGDGKDEGAFLACSCWLADCMTMQGRKDEARTLLNRVIGLANDVGLLSEEYHVPSRRLIGNVPQALTHLGVINSALFLSGPVLQRGV